MSLGALAGLQKVLGQHEIEMILGQPRGNFSESDASDRRLIQPCNFRDTGQMSEAFVRFMTNLFEGFARSASNAIGAFLRTHFEISLVSVEQMPVRDFLEGYLDPGSVSVLSLHPGDAAVLLKLDSSLVFPMIDVLLGGFGTPMAWVREMTEIDQGIMEGVAQILGRQLEATLLPMGVAVQLERQQNATQVQTVFAQTEKLTVLSFEAKLNETSGAVKLSFPASFATTMLRESSAGRRQQTRRLPDGRMGLRERVLNCTFSSTMGIPNLKVPLHELVALKPGCVLSFRLPVKNPVSFILGGREFFEAAPVRSGKLRAAQLLGPAKQTATGVRKQTA
jgi:flagellar motor switch protein FliM